MFKRLKDRLQGNLRRCTDQLELDGRSQLGIRVQVQRDTSTWKSICSGIPPGAFLQVFDGQFQSDFVPAHA